MIKTLITAVLGIVISTAAIANDWRPWSELTPREQFAVRSSQMQNPFSMPNPADPRTDNQAGYQVTILPNGENVLINTQAFAGKTFTQLNAEERDTLIKGQALKNYHFGGGITFGQLIDSSTRYVSNGNGGYTIKPAPRRDWDVGHLPIYADNDLGFTIGAAALPTGRFGARR